MKESYQFDRIESYINRRLSSQERELFEQEMKNDQALLDAYKIQLLEHEAMEIMVANDMKVKMKKWEHEVPENPFEGITKISDLIKEKTTKIIPLKRLNYVIAAGIILFIAAVGYWFFNQSRQVMRQENPIVDSIDTQKVSIDTSLIAPIVKEEIKSNTNDKNSDVKPKNTNEPDFIPVPSDVKEYAYDEFIEEMIEEAYELPEELFSSLKSDDEPNISQYRKALTALYDKDYNKALDEINKSTNLNQSTNQYLLGHIYFGQRKFKLAELAFENAAKNELTPIYQASLWFQTLSSAAQLPKSKLKFDESTKRLLAIEDFDYKRELKTLMEKLKN